MPYQKQKPKQSTGSSHLKRKFIFNKSQQDIDVPDGDILTGRKVYNDECTTYYIYKDIILWKYISCHHLKLNTLSPPLENIFGKTAGSVKGFIYYSQKCKSLGYRWSKQRLYHLLDDPQKLLGLQSGMTFSGLKDPYERASLIEYLAYLRFHGGYRIKTSWVN